MSQLERSIQQLCPDGVEYKPLGEVVDFTDGFPFKSEDFTDCGNYQVIKITDIFDGKINKGKTYIKKLPEKLKKDQLLTGGEVVVAMSGSTGKSGYNTLKNTVVNQRIAILRNTNQIDNGFLKHLLVNGDFEEYCFKNGTGPQNNISKSVMLKYSIPVPPLEVQQEIARILDQFTELTAELTAEFTARKKQYEYYREELLIHSKKVTWMTLGDIGNVCMCKRIMKAETRSEGDVPFFKIGTFGKEADAYISQEKFNEYRQKYPFPRKGDVLISAAGTIGRTVIYDGEPAYYQDSNIVWLDNDETKVLNKYLFYYYQLQPWAVSTGGTIARLYNDNISKAKIAVPPLEEQNRIISVLDCFYALCNDLTSGLPAEIEARRKQYQYYRDKLLQFKIHNA